MQLEPFDGIRDLFPKPHGNVRWTLEHGVRLDEGAWAKCGVLATVFERLRDRGLVASGTTETAICWVAPR